MVIEEPSVIAASKLISNKASSIAKLVAKNGGFRTHSSQPIMIGQIQILSVPQPHRVIKTLEYSKKVILSFAN